MESNAISGQVKTGMLGAFLGGMAGFAVGLLLAPEAGPRTRRRLVYQLEDLAVQTGLYVEQLLSGQTRSEARRSGDALVEDAQVRAERIRDDIDALLEEVRRQSASSDAS